MKIPIFTKTPEALRNFAGANVEGQRRPWWPAAVVKVGFGYQVFPNLQGCVKGSFKHMKMYQHGSYRTSLSCGFQLIFLVFFLQMNHQMISVWTTFCSWQKTWEARLFGRCGIAYPLCTQVGRPGLWRGTMRGHVPWVEGEKLLYQRRHAYKTGWWNCRRNPRFNFASTKKTAGCYRAL